MHKYGFLAIHDDMGITKLLFVLTANGAIDSEFVSVTILLIYSCSISVYAFYMYICGDILTVFMPLCIVRLNAFCALSENDDIKLINQ